MSEPPAGGTSHERDALDRLYNTRKADGVPAFLAELYPELLSSLRYLGTAGSCPNGGPGVFYGPFDWEVDWCVTLIRVIKWGTPQAPVATALYKLRDQRGELLYIGITDNLERRWKDHAKDKAWWPDVAVRSIEWLPSRSRALAAEANAIRTERPRYNIVHNSTTA